MKSLLIKSYTLILFCLTTATLFPASKVESVEPPPVVLNPRTAQNTSMTQMELGPISDLVNDLTNASKTPLSADKMPMTQCVLDFSDPVNAAFKIAGRLLSDSGVLTADSHKTLNVTDFSYLMCEGFAAWTRKSPDTFPKLSALFNDQNSVYNAFGKIINTMDTTQRDLSELADLAKCKLLVNQTINKDLPLLLNELFKALPSSVSTITDFAKDHESEIANAAKIFTPTIATLLNKAYIGLSLAGEALTVAEAKCSSWISRALSKLFSCSCCNK